WRGRRPAWARVLFSGAMIGSIYGRRRGMQRNGPGMSDDDLIKLYSQLILARAAAIPLTERLAQPQVSARKRSPLCGSTVTVDLDLAEGRISGFGQDVKACALGQAAAAILGANAVGRTREEIARARDQLHAMLKA